MNGLVLPWGRLHGDASLTVHLRRSVLDFDTVQEFADRLGRGEFTQVRTLPLPGRQTGITHTFTALRR
ncbi:hypothetical protein ABZZ37_14425 [Streptomyces sp. NPDC006464]|uniref:hypothetical protein n=1 Tax=Streptomyces sp. NPDC006464 TaxID=3154305 RepID=UPI0033BBCC33